MAVVGLVICLALGYLAGAIPSGVIVGRVRGVDPRSGGSGRTGATNALRTLGGGLAAIVAVADVVKGVVAVLFGGAIAGWLAAPSDWGAALAGSAAVLGHVRSVFIGFGGGRGVATGGGAMLVLSPLALLAAVPIMIVAVWRTRYVSLGSILAAGTVAATAVLLLVVGAGGLPAAVGGIFIGAIVVAAHADNIARLRSGTERRLGSG